MENKTIKKLYSFLKSMKFGIMLLMLTLILSVIGTIIPQGLEEGFYLSKYNPVIAKVILSLGFNNIYSSLVFGILFAALAINLTLCSVVRLGNIFKKLKASPGVERMEPISINYLDTSNSINSTLDNIFKQYGFNTFKESKANNNQYFSIKNKAGYFGSWLLHLGILMVIMFYAYGHITYFSGAVYGVPNSIQEVQDTDYKAKIKDFFIEYRDDETVKQYTSTIELMDKDENVLKTSNVSVNNPMRYKGYSFYQSSYGWATECSVSKKGSIIAEDIIYEKTSINISDENMGIYLNRFYPDFAASSKGMMSLTDQLKNPVVLYTLFYMGEIVKMDVIPIGEAIKWNEYEFIIDNPQRYTYLEVNKMNGQAGAVFGSILIMIGLILVFYFRPRVMIIKQEDETLYIYGDVSDNNKKLLKGEGYVDR